MKSSIIFALCAAACVQAGVATTPVSKVLTLLGSLTQKITKEGEVEAANFKEYMEWCDDGHKDTGYEIKTSKSQIEDLTATIGKATSDIESSRTKLEELADSISQDERDLSAASSIRAKELAEFKGNEAELVEAVDMLDRAINIIEKKMKGSAALMQTQFNTKDIKSTLAALSAVVDAASLSLHDKNKLLALAQNQGSSDEDDEEMGAPAAAAYKGKSGGIVDVLEDMREKAQGQLAASRKEEGTAKHNFAMLKQSLEDQIDADSKDLSESKTNKAKAAETKAVAEGDLAVTQKDLADDEESLANLGNDCAAKKDDHETSTKERAEELEALGKASKVIASMTGDAAGRVYSAASFLQVDERIATSTDLANVEVVNVLRTLAKKEKSPELMQLAGKITAAIRYGKAAGEDPFAKVKSLITDMIAKLNSDAKSEASHKEYCDKELGESATKMGELKYDISKNSAKKDKATASSVKLKGEVQDLSAELATISKSQAEADKLRSAEKKAYFAAKTDLEQGIEGVRSALKVLREYYASDAAALLQQKKESGAGGSIISMLEVIASDFGKALASEEVDEDSSATDYEKTSQMNKVTKNMKEKDVEYKTKEATSLDKSTVELSSDLESAQNELDAIMEYKKGLIGACVAVPETYEEKVARRQAELDGLKDALKILEGTGLLQQPKLRGAAVARH